jgi:hypothetical protein
VYPSFDSHVQLTISGRTLGVELTRAEVDELQSHVDSIVRRRPPPQNHAQTPMVGEQPPRAPAGA